MKKDIPKRKILFFILKKKKLSNKQQLFFYFTGTLIPSFDFCSIERSSESLELGQET